MDTVCKALLPAMVALALTSSAPIVLSVSPTTPPQALILSSTQKEYPMQYLTQVSSELRQAGYNVTFLSGSSITIRLISTQLDRYNLVIWRTDSFTLGNSTYWYLGDADNETSYEGAIGIGTVAVSNGMIAVNQEFFNKTYETNSLAHVKLAILISSMSITVAQSFIAAGVTTTIDFYQDLQAPPSLFDWVTQSLIGYLTGGNTVNGAIYKTIYNYEYAGSLDDSYLPPISYLGNGNLLLG